MKTSESITNIAKALAQFQGEVTNPKYTADNPFYKSKYTPLQDVISHIRPALAKSGLSVLQSPYSEDGESITVTTLLMHSSGEWIESDPLTMRAEKITAQGAGSIITYARRYALSAILGIASEDDDDGNIGEGSKRQQEEQQKGKQPKKQEKTPAKEEPVPREGFITVPQAKRMFALAGKGNDDIVKKVLSEYDITSTSNVPELLYKDICDKITVLAAEMKQAGQ